MTPTKAQVDAAAKAIFENMSDIDGDEADWIYFQDDCMSGAKAALAAAAEVGESSLTNLPPEKQREAHRWMDRQLVAATIERCANRIMEFSDLTPTQKENILAAIHALKEKP